MKSPDIRIDYLKNQVAWKVCSVVAVTAMILQACTPDEIKAKPIPSDNENKHPTPTFIMGMPTKETKIKPEATAAVIKPAPTPTSLSPEAGPDPKQQEKWKASIARWQASGAEGDLPQAWIDFKDGKGKLDTEQATALEKFSLQQAKWNELIRTNGIKDAAMRMVPGRTDLYLADNSGHMYIPLYRNIQEKVDFYGASGLLLAETLPGVTQRWNPEINMVEYVDANGKVEMVATAINVNMKLGIALATEGYPASEQMKIQLTTFAGEQNWLSWAGLERLTAGQRAEFRNAMKWLDEKHPLLNFLKGTKNVGIIGQTNTANAPKDGLMIGKLNLNIPGYIKPALLHEVIHKGQTGECGLGWEIGDGTIPDNILTMSDEEFVAGIRNGRFGAYQASLRAEAEVGSQSGINWRYLTTHGKDNNIVPTCKE